jgi:putative transposase
MAEVAGPHIIQRNRAACVFADDDDTRYLELAGAFECAVHACCLRTDHVHLPLTLQRSDGARRRDLR